MKSYAQIKSRIRHFGTKNYGNRATKNLVATIIPTYLFKLKSKSTRFIEQYIFPTHGMTILRTSRGFARRHEKPLTEKRVHSRRRRRRGGGGILEEARGSVTFPLGGRYPRTSRIEPSRRPPTAKSCRPIQAASRVSA